MLLFGTVQGYSCLEFDYLYLSSAAVRAVPAYICICLYYCSAFYRAVPIWTVTVSTVSTTVPPLSGWFLSGL